MTMEGKTLARHMEEVIQSRAIGFQCPDDGGGCMEMLSF